MENNAFLIEKKHYFFYKKVEKLRFKKLIWARNSTHDYSRNPLPQRKSCLPTLKGI